MQCKCQWGNHAGTGKHTNSQGPHSCQWIHSWSQPLLLTLAPSQVCALSGSSHHSCLLRSLMKDLEARALATIMDLPQHSPTTTTQLSMLKVPAVSVEKTSLLPIQANTSPCTWRPTPLDPGSQHAPVCPHPQVKLFSYWSQSIKSGRSVYFFKGEDTYANLYFSLSTALLKLCFTPALGDSMPIPLKSHPSLLFLSPCFFTFQIT